VILAGAMLLHSTPTQGASYADSVVSYVPGNASSGFTNTSAALGEPSRTTPGTFGGPVDPFNPPYLNEQVVSIGAGGSITVAFSNPILNSPAHPFGLDFMIYGNAGFMITNANYTGGGITDGTLFGANSGSTRVSVSADNLLFYQLDPTRAPIVDTLFPTDGAGNFDLPVNPQLGQKDFAGLDVAGIRSLYADSGGGAGFDLAWALDAAGNNVDLPEVRFIRVDVLSGGAEIDGFASAGAVPEPAPWMLLGLGAITLLTRWRRTA
jgi:hypothetical protein